MSSLIAPAGEVYLAASSHPQTIQTMLAEAAASIASRRGDVARVAVSQVATGGRHAGQLAHLFERSFGRVEITPFTVAGERNAMPADAARAIVARADVLFFGGGDPVLGARLMTNAGADAWVRDAHDRGAACMGISAGAMLLAAWWAEWPDSPPTGAPESLPWDGGELVRGTGVVPDLVVDCHAEEDNWNELRLVRGLVGDHLGKSANLPRFLGLPTGTGIVVSPGGAYRSVGGDPFEIQRSCTRPARRARLDDKLGGDAGMTKHRTGTSSSYGDLIQEEPTGGAQPRASRPGLVLLYAPNFEQFYSAYVFSVAELIIGRDPANPICVPEQAVSRQHARINFDGRKWFLSDLRSRNGTMLDGQFVQGDVELQHLHEIRIGDAIFKFVESNAERYVAYRLDGAVAGERRAKGQTELVGGCQVDAIAADIERIAPTELSCVILGETGTGKEVAARGIHTASGRRGSFQAINCAAIPHNLLESELFGYRRGAFSGADRDKPGLIKMADNGTVFLDEIGDMPLDAQAKLLRVLQAREVFPLGATTAERVNIRVVCATHRDLNQFVKEGKFRGDLFARLNEHVVRLPPLRERKEDIYQLARSFAARYGRPNLQFTFSFLVALLHYDWPFNVRELESCIKRGVALIGADGSRDGAGDKSGGALDTQQLPDQIAEAMKSYGERSRINAPSVLPPGVAPEGSSPNAASSRRPAPTEVELRDLLNRHRGNVAAVGRELGKERMQVHRWLKKYGISLEEYR